MNPEPVRKSPLSALRRPVFWWVWAWPTLLAALVFAATRPGYLSFDSALMFWQARNGQYFDIGGPLLPWLWHQCLLIGEGTDGIRMLIMGLIALGLAAWIWRLQAVLAGWRLWLAAGLAPLCPFLWVIWPHLWTDVLLAGLLLGLAVLCRLGEDASSGRYRSALRLGLIFGLSIAVCLTRHNGVLALPPLLWVGLASMPVLRSVWRRGTALLLLLLAVVSVAGVIRNSWVPQRLDTWAVTLLWDLQAVSVATRPDEAHSLIPPSLTGPNLRVGELRAAYLPYSATSLFSMTRSGVANPTVAPLTSAQSADLQMAWRRILTEPSYWQHRFRLARLLLGSHQNPELRGLAESPSVATLDGNPALPDFPGAAHAVFRNLIDLVFRSGLSAAALYLLLPAMLAVWRWRHLDPHLRSAVAALLGSAFCYAAPLLLIAPSAELRYLLWPVLACWCGALALAVGHRSPK